MHGTVYMYEAVHMQKGIHSRDNALYASLTHHKSLLGHLPQIPKHALQRGHYAEATAMILVGGQHPADGCPFRPDPTRNRATCNGEYLQDEGSAEVD